MKLLIVSQYYYPEQFRINDIAEQLVKQGHDVTVVTGIPNYPNGRFFSGYNYFKKRSELHEGVKIKRAFIIPRGKSKFQLIANYLSFIAGGFIQLIKLRDSFDMIFAYQVSPMLQVIPTVWYSNKRKIPLVLYVTDLWPESVEFIGNIKNKLILKTLSKISAYIYNNSEHTLVSSVGFVNNILKYNSKNLITYLPIYSERMYLLKQYRASYEGGFSFVFAGNIGYAQGLSNIVLAVSKIPYHKIDFKIKIIGDGRKKNQLVKEISNLGLENLFEFYGRMSPEETANIVSKCNVAIISLEVNEINKLTLPAKTQSLLAMGMPILVVGEGEISRIVTKADCGLTVTPKKPELLSESIIDFRNLSKERFIEMSDNAHSYYELNFSEEKFFSKLNAFFEDLFE